MLSSFWVQRLIFISVVYNPVMAANSTIKLLIVMSRHTDRAPDPSIELYFKDPYVNYNFDPPGFAKVTKRGELRALNLGKFILNTHKDFLAPKYIPGSIEARCIDISRTKDSSNFILKGLYPGAQVPLKFDTIVKDVLLCPQLCPEYVADYLKARETTEIKGELKKLEGFIKNLNTWTGSKMNAAVAMYLLYSTLEAETYMNLTIPPWTKNVYPAGDLLKGTLLEFKIMNYDQNMMKRIGGRLIQKFIQDMESVKRGSMDKNRKLMLYVGYDLNVVALLKALGVFDQHVPTFSSAVFLELHLINKVYSVKVNYYEGVTEKMKDLQIPGCGKLCPLDKFTSLMKNVIPSGKDLICNKVKGSAGLGSQFDPAGPIMGKFTGIFTE